MRLHPLSLLAALFVLIFGSSCEEPIEPGIIGFDELLVVEGAISNQFERQTIRLSRTTPLNESGIRPESGAQVWVEILPGGRQSFVEEAPGQYVSATPFAATPAGRYQLHITTLNGASYASDEQTLALAAPLDTLYAEFIQDPARRRGEGTIVFYFDVQNPDAEIGYYRWHWEETYRIKVPLPSRWRWLGGDVFEPRDESKPEEQEEYCYRQERTTSILLGSTANQSRKLLRYPIHQLDTDSRKLVQRYSFTLTQWGLSDDAREYWQGVQRSTQNQGSLFDEQPGTLVGNMHALSNAAEPVLGIFEVSSKSTLKAYYRPSDFYDQGLVVYSYNWVDCEASELIDVRYGQEGKFMQQYGDVYELNDYYTGLGPMFAPRACALCTLYGSNVAPDDWEE